MKTLKILLSISILLLFSCEDSTSDISDSIDNETKEMIDDTLIEISEEDKIFEVESGKITFEYSGKWTGTETVWFDQYGKRVVIEQDIYHSARNHNKTKMIWTGDKESSYNCNYISMGEETNSSANAFMRPKDTELSLFAHGDATQLAQNYSQIGDDMKAGKQASGWKSRSNDIIGWIWKGIDLEYNNMGVIKTALKFEELSEIPKGQLDPHQGF
ncbi:MAG: hypothetical protein ACI865_000984 [Flavobacteriaceae bacterium]|jgi:hypothetical protein